MAERDELTQIESGANPSLPFKSSVIPTGLQQYLAEISEIKFLNPEEEKRLAQQMEVHPDSFQARNRLIESILPFAVYKAERQVDRGLSLEDLIGFANDGAFHAVDKYDWQKGKRLITYAGDWIINALQRALAYQSRAVEIPDRIYKADQKIRRVKARLNTDLGRPPENEELADELGLSLQRLKQIRQWLEPSLSINVLIRNQSKAEHADQLADPQVEETLEHVTQRIAILDVIGQLPVKIGQALKLSFGFNEFQYPYTYSQIGEIMGISENEAGNLVKAGKKILKQPENAHRLRSCFEN